LKHFGAFFRINEILISPLDPDKSTQDIFKNEYLELAYYLQMAMEGGKTTVEGKDYTIEDFCFRPITG
jgi:hypothetical protein